MPSQDERRRITFRYVGGCALAAGVDSETLELRDSEDEMNLLSSEIAARVGGSIPYAVMRRGVLLKQVYASGRQVEDGDTLSIVPIVLGG